MKKNKKILIIVISIILVLAVILGIIFLVSKNKQGNTNEIQEAQKTEKVYEEVSKANQITFTCTLDDKNKETIIVKDNNAYKETTKDGKTSRYIVKDGNTYFLDEDSKKYYTYNNNTSILIELKQQLEKLQDLSKEAGKERIKGKNYSYEEFEQYQGFLINNKIAVTDLTKAKTRIYYDNDKIVYIKTIAGDEKELLKVDISYNQVNDDYFNIPDEYKDGNI
ncbi:MAG: hypothetical protein V8R82_05185 [Clostridia bacterium]